MVCNRPSLSIIIYIYLCISFGLCKLFSVRVEDPHAPKKLSSSRRLRSLHWPRDLKTKVKPQMSSLCKVQTTGCLFYTFFFGLAPTCRLFVDARKIFLRARRVRIGFQQKGGATLCVSAPVMGAQDMDSGWPKSMSLLILQVIQKRFWIYLHSEFEKSWCGVDPSFSRKKIQEFPHWMRGEGGPFCMPQLKLWGLCRGGCQVLPLAATWDWWDWKAPKSCHVGCTVYLGDGNSNMF